MKKIGQLNNQFVGQIDSINNQLYIPLQDFYVIKGQVPIEQVTINRQTYYVIEANSINPANIVGFLLIIFYVIVRRLRPRKFKIKRIYIWTIVYISLVLFLAAQIGDSLILLSLPVSGILGYILGLKILEKREIKFFYKNDILYYKWPTSIIILWSGLFVIRLFLEFFGSKNIIVLSIVDLLLSFSTGLIVSASNITIKQAKQFLTENAFK
jgi:hypothetical protein